MRLRLLILLSSFRRMVIYVPKIGENPPIESTVAQEPLEGGEEETTKININEADKRL